MSDVVTSITMGRACIADEARHVGETGTRAHAIDISRDLPSAHVEFEVSGWLRLCLTQVREKQSKIGPLHIFTALMDWQTRWAAEVDRLKDVTLDNTLTRPAQLQQSTADRAPDIPTNTRQRRQPSAPQPMDGTLHPRRPRGQLERDESTNHTRSGARTPLLQRPHFKHHRHLRRTTDIHRQIAGRHRRHSIHGIHLGTIRGPASPHLALDPSWHQPLHGRCVPQTRDQARGEQCYPCRRHSPPRTSLTPPSQTQGCPSSIQSAPARMTPPTAGCGAPSEGPCTTASTETKPSGSTRALSPSGQGWLNHLNPQKLRRVAGPYILYPVLHGMDDHCPRLWPGDPCCGHPCPHALFQPLPPQAATLPGRYLNAVAGPKGVYLTAGETAGQAIPLGQVHHMAMGPRLSNTDKPRVKAAVTALRLYINVIRISMILRCTSVQ